MIATDASLSIALGAIAAISTAGVAWFSQRALARRGREDRRGQSADAHANAKVAEQSATLTAWDQIVKALQAEVERITDEVRRLRVENVDLLDQLAAVESKLADLRVQLAVAMAERPEGHSVP